MDSCEAESNKFNKHQCVLILSNNHLIWTIVSQLSWPNLIPLTLNWRNLILTNKKRITVYSVDSDKLNLHLFFVETRPHFTSLPVESFFWPTRLTAPFYPVNPGTSKMIRKDKANPMRDPRKAIHPTCFRDRRATVTGGFSCDAWNMPFGSKKTKYREQKRGYTRIDKSYQIGKIKWPQSIGNI